MTPYLLVFSWLSFAAIVDHVKQPSYLRLFFYLISVLTLVLFAGLRQAGVGADDFNYIDKFLEVPDLTYWMSGEFRYSLKEIWMEPSYIFLGSLIRVFTDQYTFLFLAVASISVGAASYGYYKYSPYWFLSLLLFFSHTFLYRDINQIRAAVAAAVGLFLIEQIHKRNIVKCILIILAACSFHLAAASYLLVLLLSYIPIGRKSLLVGYFMSIFVGLLGVSYLMLGVLPNLGFVTIKLISYSESRYAESVSLFDLTNIKNSIIFFVLIFFWKVLEKQTPYFNTMMLFYSLAVMWRIAFADFGIFAARIATFFGVVEVILVPSLILLIRQKILGIFLIIVYAFSMLYLNLFVKEGRYPYSLSFDLI